MLHYRIAILHAKTFLLNTLVTPINTLYILYLSMPSYVLSSYLLNVHMEVLLLLTILLILTIYKMYKISKYRVYLCVSLCVCVCVCVCV